MEEVYLINIKINDTMKLMSKLSKLMSGFREWLFLKSMRSSFIH